MGNVGTASETGDGGADRDEVDDHQDQEHHQTHREVAADQKLAEGLDDLAGGVAAEEGAAQPTGLEG